MAYWGGYPEPLNDPEYDENSDDITAADILKMWVAFAVFATIAILTECL